MTNGRILKRLQTSQHALDMASKAQHGSLLFQTEHAASAQFIYMQKHREWGGLCQGCDRGDSSQWNEEGSSNLRKKNMGPCPQTSKNRHRPEKRKCWFHTVDGEQMENLISSVKANTELSGPSNSLRQRKSWGWRPSSFHTDHANYKLVFPGSEWQDEISHFLHLPRDTCKTDASFTPFLSSKVHLVWCKMQIYQVPTKVSACGHLPYYLLAPLPTGLCPLRISINANPPEDLFRKDSQRCVCDSCFFWMCCKTSLINLLKPSLKSTPQSLILVITRGGLSFSKLK